MDYIQRAFMRVTLEPSHESGSAETTDTNGDGFVDFSPADTEDPRNWSRARKWFISIIATFLTTNGHIASTITTATTESIMSEFDATRIAAQLTTTLFLLGFCAGPILFAPLSEFYGRRWILYATLPAYLGFTCLTAWPRGFAGLLIGRFLAGVFVSATAIVAPSNIVDMWDPIARGNSIAIYSCASWAGPATGSVISGFVQLKKDWRWAIYVTLWLGGFSLLLMFTARRARHHGRRPGDKEIQAQCEASRPNLVHIFKISLTRPWILLFDTISFLCCIYSCLIFALQFMLFTIYPLVFRDMRGWNAGVSQLPLLGQAAGGAIGALIIIADTKYRKNKAASGKELLPEDHMRLAMIGGVGFPVFMFWLSWSANYNSVHWIVPTIAGALLATCLMLIFVANLNYIVDVYAEYAASVIAVNTLARCSCSAAAPLFTSQMFAALGVGGGGSLIAGMAALLAAIPFLLHHYGPVIRSRSKYAQA
ncbi:major facilitator superfamily domain-containing protein [Microdochium bolleyi]|uniref:Major facilitator superfamily domain-containing protein n=1 Tax=Microdochium bolleyi TaxID=196109 RepID=A0A136IM20_9PEZI|nr:major facilitator superfamily domain-containing protein [Microdochium bolleyi]